MTEPSYHERVARAMKKTWAAGSLNSYEEILAALRKKFPTEDELRAYVASLEGAVKSLGFCTPDYDFLRDSESRDCPGCERSMSVRETQQGLCDECAAGEPGSRIRRQ